jgi:arsenical pump membrane protein
VLLFVIAMSIVVRGFEHAWLTGNTVPLPAEPVRALLAAAGVNAVGSNVVNNVPMVLLSGAVIETAPAPLHEVLTVGTLIGANIGPALTTYGSLATILWLAGLRREGIEIATRDYLHMSLIVVPAALIAALVGAAVTLNLY